MSFYLFNLNLRTISFKLRAKIYLFKLLVTNYPLCYFYHFCYLVYLWILFLNHNDFLINIIN